ncbi:MAG: DNA primase, partial [Planctomycetota bacterium]
MARIPEDVTQAVRDAVDVVELISNYVQLRPSGASFRGLCPFHDEKTPSFHVFPQSGRYKCFGCSEGGDAFSFLMKRQNLSFPEAIRELGRRVGIEVPDRGDVSGEGAARRKRTLEALRFAARFFRELLRRPVGAGALAYLKGRGITDETVEAFGLGFAPPEWEGLCAYARSKGWEDRTLLDAGLARKREDASLYDMFRGRIVFPIHDLGDRVIGFGARALGDEQPKYINSPDGPLFHKGREVYGLNRARDAARRAGRLLLVEGYTDVLWLHQAGLREAVATLGTALTPQNAHTLNRYGVPVVVLYDGDRAGAAAAERAAETLLAEGAQGSVALLPEGRDPADLAATGGAQAVEEAAAAASELFRFVVDRTAARHDLASVGGRTRAAREVLRVAARSTDRLQQDAALHLVSERFGLSEEVLRREIPRAPGGSRRAAPGPEEGTRAPARWARA